MGDRVKGLYDCTCVLVMHLVMTASLVLEVTWSKYFDHVQDDPQCDRGRGCPTFMSRKPDTCLYLSSQL